MNKYLNKVLIVDGSYMLHRGLRTPGLEELKTSKGVKSGGVFGVLRMLQSEIKKFPGYFPIVCWDKGLAKRRTELFPDYKANRQRVTADTLIGAGVASEEDDYLKEYHRQRTDVIQILKALGVPSLLLSGWEGDDLQYLLSKVCNEGVVVSDDKDMIQLVAPNIKIRRAVKGETIEWSDSDPYYRHPHYVIAKSIVGDGSDNIPQVASGVGGKSADKIATLIDSKDFSEWKSELERYCEETSGAFVKKVRAVIDNWDQFLINYQLTDLRLVEPPEGFESMIKDLILGVVGKPNIMKAYELIGQYEMSSIYPDRIIFTLAPSSASVIIK